MIQVVLEIALLVLEMGNYTHGATMLMENLELVQMEVPIINLLQFKLVQMILGLLLLLVAEQQLE